MTGVLTAGCLVLDGEDVALVARLAQAWQASRRRNGQPSSARADHLADLCQRALAAAGHPDVRCDPVDESLGGGGARMVGTAQAAQQLGKSERQVRRMAQALGGRKRGGTWYIDLDAIEQHLEGASHG